MDNPKFFLEGIVKEKDRQQDFDGPLSLILLLLSKNKIEIRDIRISDILDQYLEYLDKMQSMDLDIASEFVQMASHLLYIKTKMLLSGDEQLSELEVLMSSLEQLKARETLSGIQQILPRLKKASETGLLYYPKPPEPLNGASFEYRYRHSPIELLTAMLSVCSRGVQPEPPDLKDAVPKRIIYSVKDKSLHILEVLKHGKAKLNDLYRECSTRSEIVATFMSVLELCSMGNVLIKKYDGEYSLEFAGGDIGEIIEKIVE